MPPKRKQPQRRCKTVSNTIVDDDVFLQVMEEFHIDCFDSLSDASRVMSRYEYRSKCRVSIKRSGAGQFRVYHCVTHKGCMFKVHFGRRRKDGKFIVKGKQSVFQHAVVGSNDDEMMDDGKQWRPARAEKVKEYVLELVSRKQQELIERDGHSPYSDPDVLKFGMVTADDVLTFAQNKGDAIPYRAALRAIRAIKLEKEEEEGKTEEGNTFVL